MTLVELATGPRAGEVLEIDVSDAVTIIAVPTGPILGYPDVILYRRGEDGRFYMIATVT